MSEWKPGTVAVARVRGVPNVQVLRIAASYEEAATWFSATSVDHTGGRYHREGDVIDVRPLVVLDPHPLAPHRLFDHFGRLLDALPKDKDVVLAEAVLTVRELMRQVQAQTRPPKPPEPTGLGAVVKDRDGALWVKWCLQHRAERCWKNATDTGLYLDFSAIDAVEVLSPGVTP